MISGGQGQKAAQSQSLGSNIARAEGQLASLKTLADGFYPPIEQIHDLVNRINVVTEHLIGPRPENGSGRAQPPMDPEAPLIQRLERGNEDIRWAVERLADAVTRLESRIA